MMTKKLIIAIVAIALLPVGWWYYNSKEKQNFGKPIKVGILHSLSGTMAISEKSVVESTLLAIDEINEKGGLLGRRIEPIVADGRSDWPTFAKEAERLIAEEKVSVVFGCWTSASRKTVKPVFEKYNHLLFYPIQYEGIEQSPNIVYTGATPNQQIIPAVKWCFENLGKKFFLVGSDYVFPRTANAIIKDHVASLRGEVIGEEYIPIGSSDVKRVIHLIRELQPDLILNTINGDSNVAFFRELRRAGITPRKIPTMSFSIAEDELRILGVEPMVGNYASWNYFESIDSKENAEFIKLFQKRFGSHRRVDDPMEAGYIAVRLWAQAVKDAGSEDVEEVRKRIGKQSLNAPGGIVYVDPETLHTWKTVRIGKIRKDGQFDIIWSSEHPIRPVPFPVSRSKEEWIRFLEDLYINWGNKWSAEKQ